MTETIENITFASVDSRLIYSVVGVEIQKIILITKYIIFKYFQSRFDVIYEMNTCERIQLNFYFYRCDKKKCCVSNRDNT